MRRRLVELCERCGAALDAKDPLFPFPAWMLDELGGQTSRYVFELIQQFRRIYLATGILPSLDDMPPPPAATANDASLSAPLSLLPLLRLTSTTNGTAS